MPDVLDAGRDVPDLSPAQIGRVLIVNAHGADLAFGGAERHVADLGLGLIERGAQVSLLAAFPQARAEPGLEVRTLHATDWRASVARRVRNQLDDVASRASARLRSEVRRAAPDIVHTHNLPGIGTGIWEVCRTLGIPVVHTGHDYSLRCRRGTLVGKDGSACCATPALCGLRRSRLARWAPGVSQLIAVSGAVAERLAPSLPGVPVEIVHNPVRPLADRPLRPPGPGLRTLGYMGALLPEKGIRELIAVAQRLGADGITVRVAGGGPLEGEVRAASDAGVIDFVGYVAGEERLAFIESCDAGIVPSRWEEPYPLVAVEWLVAGRPALLAARGGMRDIAAQYPGAEAIEPDEASIADAVARLREPEVWARTVVEARANALADEGPAWLDRHLEIYAKVRAAAGVAR